MPNRCTITLPAVAAPAPVLKLLRRAFPDVSLEEHRRRVLAGEPVYSSERENPGAIGLTRLTALLRLFDEAGVEVTLSEETFRGGRWEPLPESRSQLRRMLGDRFRLVSWVPDDSKEDNMRENQQNAIGEETIVIVLDPGKLENPDLDLRYDVPARIEAATEGAVRDGGYDYIDPPPDRPGPLMGLFLRTGQPAAGLWPKVLELLRRERFLDNDLSRLAEIYISCGPRAELADCVRVYPV